MTALVPHVASRAPVGYTRGPFGATGRKRTFALRDDDGQYRQMGDLKRRLLGGACAATLKAKGSVAAAIADQATRMACDTPSFAGLGNEAARKRYATFFADLLAFETVQGSTFGHPKVGKLVGPRRHKNAAALAKW